VKPTANIIHKCEILSNLSPVIRNRVNGVCSHHFCSTLHWWFKRAQDKKKVYMVLRLEKKDKAVLHHRCHELFPGNDSNISKNYLI